MKKRILSILLATALLLGALPVQAWAAQFDPFNETAPIPTGPADPEQAELFAGYVEQVFSRGDDYEETQLAAAGYGEVALSGANLQIYRWLKEKIIEVANGKLSSSVFEFDTSSLGITYKDGAYQGLNTQLIIRTLLVDLPYEQYWFDKAKGWSTTRTTTSAGAVVKMKFSLHVYPDYAVYNETGTEYYIYQPDPAKTGAAMAAAKNAQAVVAQNSSLADYDKLIAYRDYICAQVEYNYDAADKGSAVVGGNPWQLIYVFDNNPSTNVVCEGYSKAFKYLCDQSTFFNDIACYTVSGYTTGAHMWNLIRVNGQSYMADLTACDTKWENVPPLDALFLAGDPNGTADGYTIHVPRYDIGGGSYVPAHSITYTYQEKTTAVFPASILTLARSDLNPASLPTAPTTPARPSSKFTDMASGAYYLDAVDWAVENGVTTGTTATTFEPEKTCTHGEILTFLWRAKGEPSSSAQPPISMTGNEFYYEAVKWAAGENILTTSFNAGTPNAPCNRLYAVYYIWLAFGKPDTSIANPFTDVANNLVGTQAVLWALEKKITTGATATTFEPATICSRGQIVTFLYRAYQ